jgi:hypothetical protein
LKASFEGVSTACLYDIHDLFVVSNVFHGLW